MTDACQYLIVDDNEADRFLNGRILRRLGIDRERVFEAADGEQALQVLNGPLADKPTVVLLDINMPVMNGFEFLREWESHPRDDTPMYVIIVTSSQDEHDKQTMDKYQTVAAYLTKPLDPSELDSCLRTALSDFPA